MNSNLKKYLKLSILISGLLAIIAQITFALLNKENFTQIGYFIFPIAFLAAMITPLVFSYNYRQILITEGAFKPNFIFNVVVPVIPLALLSYFGYRDAIFYYVLPLIIVRLSNQIIISNIFAKEKKEGKELFSKKENGTTDFSETDAVRPTVKVPEISEKEKELLKKENELLQKEIDLLKKEKEINGK